MGDVLGGGCPAGLRFTCCLSCFSLCFLLTFYHGSQLFLVEAEEALFRAYPPARLNSHTAFAFSI